MPLLLAFLPIQHVQKLFRLTTDVLAIFSPVHISRRTLVWPAGRRVLVDGVDGDGRLEQFGVLLEIHPELMSYDIILIMDDVIERFVVVGQKPRRDRFRRSAETEDSQHCHDADDEEHTEGSSSPVIVNSDGLLLQKGTHVGLLLYLLLWKARNFRRLAHRLAKHARA